MSIVHGGSWPLSSSQWTSTLPVLFLPTAGLHSMMAYWTPNFCPLSLSFAPHPHLGAGMNEFSLAKYPTLEDILITYFRQVVIDIIAPVCLATVSQSLCHLYSSYPSIDYLSACVQTFAWPNLLLLSERICFALINLLLKTEVYLMW